MIGVEHDAVFLNADDLRDDDAARTFQLQFLAEFELHILRKLILWDVDYHLFAHGAIGLIGGDCANDAAADFQALDGVFKAGDHHALAERKFQGFTTFARVEYRPIGERSFVVNTDEISNNCRHLDFPFARAVAPLKE